MPIGFGTVGERPVVGEQRGSEKESRVEGKTFQMCAHRLTGSVDTLVIHLDVGNSSMTRWISQAIEALR